MALESRIIAADRPAKPPSAGADLGSDSLVMRPPTPDQLRGTAIALTFGNRERRPS